MTTTTTEEILVLYGSQTGNSEAAAHEICTLLPVRLSSSSRQRKLTSRVMHLDDFLEVEHGKWTRLVIIVCSSYGVGQAPIGARKFREFCDDLLDRKKRGEEWGVNKGGSGASTATSMLGGISFALLGLGDSHYTTYFRNPTVIHDALTAYGATLIGEIGKADASGTGNLEQSKVIERWIEGIWETLDGALEMEMPDMDFLDKAREGTWEVCLDIFPDWKPARKLPVVGAAFYLPLVGIILAMLVHHYFSRIGQF
jgi:sulfite reductase alpha subunit-like flavoprotein